MTAPTSAKNAQVQPAAPHPDILNAAKKCPYDKKYGDIICKDGTLWALTYSEMGPPDSRQNHGPCPFCSAAKPDTQGANADE